MAISATHLLERESQLERLEERLAHVRGGQGGVLLLEGPAGVGKTEMVRALRYLAHTGGVAVLGARGSELERDIAYGVVRSLFERAVRESPDEEREALLAGAADLARPVLGIDTDGQQPSDPFAVLHGLYWLCANLAAARGPLVLAVDDAHWADPQSLRWLGYLAPRLEDLPVLVVGALRPGESEDAEGWVAALAADRLAETVTLAPLGEAAVSRLVRARHPSADATLCRACHTATGGNPYLLRELIGALEGDGAPSTEEVELVGAAAVARYVRVRLERLGTNATALVGALAVLGESPLRQVAQLAGVAPEDAAATVDALRTADVIAGTDTVDFVHPLVRAAVYNDIPLGARRAAHDRAARLLDEQGAPVERIAAHLLAGEPNADPWAVDRLRRAAARALESGAPDAAARYLRRALDEPAPAELRAAVTLDLGLALFPVDPAAAAAQLREALALTETPEQQVAVAVQLAKALSFSDRPREAVEVLEEALARLPGDVPELAVRARRELLLWAHFWTEDDRRPQHSAQLREAVEPLAGDTADEGAMLGLLAWDLVVGDTPAAEVLEVAERALRPGLTFIDPSQGFEVPTLIASVFMFCDELERSVALFGHGISELRANGWLVHLAFAYSHSAHARLRQGALRDAEVDARTSWELASQLGPALPAWWYSFGNLIQVLVARGLASEAETIVAASGVGEQVPDAVIYPLPRVMLGELRVALGDLEGGAADLRAAGTWLDARGFTNPAWSAWRMPLTGALIGLGHEDEAREVAREAVARAQRFGAPSTLGRALRAEALADRERRIALLEESVATLERSPAAYEHAVSLVELGAALRRAKRSADARAPLRLALDRAQRLGADGLAQRALTELTAAGAKPRSRFLSGVESLTPSELRVCEQAAAGRTNAEIAQALFVTMKTVETHLAHAYRKLDIRGRAELPATLAATH